MLFGVIHNVPTTVKRRPMMRRGIWDFCRDCGESRAWERLGFRPATENWTTVEETGADDCPDNRCPGCQRHPSAWPTVELQATASVEYFGPCRIF